MPRIIEENNENYILYDNCEEYIYVGSFDPGYDANGVFTDAKLTSCCKGQELDRIPVTPTPTVSVTPTITPTISPTQTPTPTTTPTVTPTVTPSITPTISVTPSITPTISVTPSITPTLSVTPTITPTISLTPSVTVSPTPSVTATVTTTPTVTSTPTVTPTISITPSVTPTVTPTITVTPTVTATPTTTPTPSPTVNPGTVPGVDVIDLNDSLGNAYEILSIDYGVKTSETQLNNNNVVAVCCPTNNYDHKLSSTLPDTVSDPNSRNLLFTSNTYFTQYQSSDTISTFANIDHWNYTQYPAGRISSVHFNRDLSRWFLGAQSLSSESHVFLYGFNNGSASKFYIGGDDSGIYTGTSEDFSMTCGPTKVYSFNNSVVLANSYHTLLYTTTNTNTDELYFDSKKLAFTCDSDIATSVCGIDWTDVPSSLTNLYEHLATIVKNNDGLQILYNAPASNNIIIDNASQDCTTTTGISSSSKGYFVGSYGLSYTLSSTVNPDTGDNIIQILFNKDIIVDLATDVILVLNGRSVGRGGGTNWDITGSGKVYSLSANNTIYNSMISNKKGYTLAFDLTSMASTILPSHLSIPLYQADIGFSVNNNYLKDIRSNNSSTAAFIVNDNLTNTTLEYFVNDSTTCDNGYNYIIEKGSTQYSLCISDMAGTYNDSEIKCVLCRDGIVYYLVQQSRDPQNPSSSAVYRYNLYKADISTPYQTTLIAANFGVVRHLGSSNRTITNKWNNTSFIDDRFIIAGVPNTNKVFRIDYKNLSPVNPSLYIGVEQTITTCDITDNDCFDAWLPFGGGTFDMSATITGKSSGAVWRSYAVTYNSQKGNCNENGECYFIVTCGSGCVTQDGGISQSDWNAGTRRTDGSSLNDWQIGERVDIVASIGTEILNVKDAFVCSKQYAITGEYGDEQYDKLILKCTGDGLSGSVGYNVDDLILNANTDFVP